MKYQNIISKMTLEEKVSMMSGKTFWQTEDIERLGIPSITLSDGPHGIRKQVGEADHLGLNKSGKATCYPTAATMANSWDIKLGEAIGEHLGVEAAAQGVNVLLGPGLNIKRSPLCGRNFEYFSEDPYLAGKMAASYVKGIQSQGVVACPKHFAANSQELRRMSSDSIMDERTFREIYTTGFEIAVKEGKAKSIMSAYNKINGIYANENEHLLQEILVDEWGFDGIVVSDWGASNDNAKGVMAGSHLEMPTTGADGIRLLIDAIKTGRLKEEVLDQRVDELLDVVFRTSEQIEDKKGKPFNITAHHKMASIAAEGCVVLLKNQDNFLPLASKKKVAVIGDFAKISRYQGAGSSVVNPTRLDNTLEVMGISGFEMVGFEPGFMRNGKVDEKQKSDAVSLARKAEVVLLYLGLDEVSESEGMDRDHMRLAENQIALLKAVAKVNENVVVVLSSGAAIEMDWTDSAKAIIHGYLGGQAGPESVLNVINGTVCPSGRLSETYPLKYEDTPAHQYYLAKEKTSEYREGIFVGYRYYDTAHVPVKYPFGYGLSYTTFLYSDIKVTKDKVELVVTNTGKVDGAEVVQIYIAANNSKLFRPAKELKGFTKVFLRAGESQIVEILLDDKAFRYYNVKTKGWEIESGDYTIMAAANIEDIRLVNSIYIEGTNAEIPYSKEKFPSYYKADITNVSDDEFRGLLGHEIPSSKWNRSEDLTLNDSVCQMHYAKSWLARLIFRILNHIKKSSMAKGKPNLNVYFIYNIPFRGIAKMTGGAVSMEMVDGMLLVVNGHFFKGLGKLIKGVVHNKKK